MEAIRGRDIAMIFQDPMTSLNPIHTIGRQIMESLQVHHGLDHRAAERETVELLRRVGLRNRGSGCGISRISCRVE